MITTPYFKQLEFLAFKTSKLRSQNNKLFDSLLNNGFSKSEALDITETESFIIPRIAKKKTCSNCGGKKTLSFFSKHKREKDGYNNNCKKCTRMVVNKSYKKNRAQYVLDKKLAYFIKQTQ